MDERLNDLNGCVVQMMHFQQSATAHEPDDLAESYSALAARRQSKHTQTSK
jgi:hypothetical protein